MTTINHSCKCGRKFNDAKQLLFHIHQHKTIDPQSHGVALQTLRLAVETILSEAMRSEFMDLPENSDAARIIDDYLNNPGE